MFLLVPFGAVAFALSIAATAYACTAFNGTFTVTMGGNSVTATGTDPQSVPAMTQTLSASRISSATTGANFTIATAATGGAGSTQLAPGTYNVDYYRGATVADGPVEAYEDDQWVVDCMSSTVSAAITPPAGSPGNGGFHRLGSTTIGTTGAVTGATSFSTTGITSQLGVGQAAICISNASTITYNGVTGTEGFWGNEVPVTIT